MRWSRPSFPTPRCRTTSAKVRHVLSLRQEPTPVAAHSYGSQAGTALGSDAPNVVGLVHVAAFGLDGGEHSR
jgi:pimeloyl-ACP methyl ester carboxylesterase